MNKNIFRIGIIFPLIISSFLILGFNSVKTEKDLLEEGNVIRSEVDYMNRIKSLDELENITNTSIKAEVLPEKTNIKLKDCDGYTITNLKIKEIYKGENIKVGDIISIREPYYRDYLEDKEYLFIDDKYIPAEVGKEYIFVLNYGNFPYPDENNNIIKLYYMCNTIFGKYPVVNNKLRLTPNVEKMLSEDLELNISNEDLGLSRDIKDFKNIYEDILNKYN